MQLDVSTGKVHYGDHSACRGGHRLPSSHRRRRAECGFGQVDVPLGKALENLLQRDASLQARQRRAEAEMGADAEGEVLTRWAVDIELFAVGAELAWIAVGGPDQHHHCGAFG